MHVASPGVLLQPVLHHRGVVGDYAQAKPCSSPQGDGFWQTQKDASGKGGLPKL